MKKRTSPTGDPRPYDGPMCRIDGVAPFNRYLWPLTRDWFWANHHLDHRFSPRFHFHAIALKDGRWLADGHVHEDESEMTFHATRQGALFASASAMLRTASRARHWSGPDHLTQTQYVKLGEWARDIIARPRTAWDMDPDEDPDPLDPPEIRLLPHETPDCTELPLFAGGML